MKYFNMLKFAMALMTTVAAVTASAKVTCYVNGENPTIPGRYDQFMWTKVFKGRGEEKHFLLLSADGRSITEVAKAQVSRGADVSAIQGRTVIDIKRYKNGSFGYWTNIVDPSGDQGAGDELLLKVQSITLGAVTKSVPLQMVFISADKPHLAISCNAGGAKGD